MTKSDNSRALRLEQAVQGLEHSLKAWAKDGEAGASLVDFEGGETPDARIEHVDKYFLWLPVHIYKTKMYKKKEEEF